MPDYYYELRRQQAAAIEGSLAVFEELGRELGALTGRMIGGVERYRLEDAERVLVCLASTAGTVKDVVDELRDEGQAVGLLRICSYRPFPAAEIAEALDGATEVVVLDRADSPAARRRWPSRSRTRPGRCAVTCTGSAAASCTPATSARCSQGSRRPQDVGVRSESCPA